MCRHEEDGDGEEDFEGAGEIRVRVAEDEEADDDEEGDDGGGVAFYVEDEVIRIPSGNGNDNNKARNKMEQQAGTRCSSRPRTRPELPERNHSLLGQLLINSTLRKCNRHD